MRTERANLRALYGAIGCTNKWVEVRLEQKICLEVARISRDLTLQVTISTFFTYVGSR